MANINYEWKEEALKIYNFHEAEKKPLIQTARHFSISKTKTHQYVLVGEFLSKNPDSKVELFSDCLNLATQDKSNYYTLKTSEFFTISKLIEKSVNFYIVELLNRNTEFRFVAVKPYEVRPSLDWEVDLWKKKDLGMSR